MKKTGLNWLSQKNMLMLKLKLVFWYLDFGGVHQIDDNANVEVDLKEKHFLIFFDRSSNNAELQMWSFKTGLTLGI